MFFLSIFFHLNYSLSSDSFYIFHFVSQLDNLCEYPEIWLNIIPEWFWKDFSIGNSNLKETVVSSV